MIEKIITSKTRVKLLNLFLTHIDARYYLRELERMLDESLSPLRRQLMKLEKMGILKIEKEANLKYYRLNKEFVGMEELRRLVLGADFGVAHESARKEGERESQRELSLASPNVISGVAPERVRLSKRVRYDVLVLGVVSILVLSVAVFVLYTSSKNIKQVAGMFPEKTVEVVEVTERAFSGATPTKPTRPDEMVSKKWKLFPGIVPVLSSGDTGTRSEEL